jgi:hypothetical protein
VVGSALFLVSYVEYLRLAECGCMVPERIRVKVWFGTQPSGRRITLKQLSEVPEPQKGGNLPRRVGQVEHGRWLLF